MVDRRELVLTRAQVREVDQRAIEALGIPGVVLMENAAIGATRVLLERAGSDRQGALKVAVICGAGNNGGDGYAMARHLHIAGVRVVVYAMKAVDELRGDAAVNARVCEQLGFRIEDLSAGDAQAMDRAAAHWGGCDVLVDAMLGTGFEGQVREPIAEAIARVNRSEGVQVLAVDVPSGLNCQTGEPAQATVRADWTATFVARKSGFAAEGARQVLGEVVVVGIGVPTEWVGRVIHGNENAE